MVNYDQKLFVLANMSLIYIEYDFYYTDPEPDCQDIWSDAKCQKRKNWCAGGKKVRKYCKKTCELCG